MNLWTETIPVLFSLVLTILMLFYSALINRRKQNKSLWLIATKHFDLWNTRCAWLLYLNLTLLFFFSISQIIPGSYFQTYNFSWLSNSTVRNCLRLGEVFGEILQYVCSVLAILPLCWLMHALNSGVRTTFYRGAEPNVPMLGSSEGAESQQKWSDQ